MTRKVMKEVTEKKRGTFDSFPKEINNQQSRNY